MESSVQGPDILNLNSVLTSLECDLSISYLHSRPKFEDDLVQQINHALNEIVNREHDLKASIGISKILLSSYSSLKQANEELFKKNEDLTQNLEIINKKLIKAKAYKEKFYETEALLEEKEKELAQESLKPEKLSKERVYKNVNLSYDCISLDRLSAELNDMDLKYRDEYNIALSKFYAEAKIKAENRCVELENKLKNKNNKLLALKSQKSSQIRMSTDIESSHGCRHSLKAPSESVIEDLDCELGRWESTRFSFLKNLEICRQESIGIEEQKQVKFTEEIYFSMVKNI